jgi:hypothetical protein
MDDRILLKWIINNVGGYGLESFGCKWCPATNCSEDASNILGSRKGKHQQGFFCMMLVVSKGFGSCKEENM